MQIHEGIEGLPDFTRPVVTSGTFDGVHVGHQAILKRVVDLARKDNAESIMITFWPHPRAVINPDEDIKLLSTFKEKSQRLAQLGIDHLIKIPFTKKFSSLSSDEFIRKVLVDGINTSRLVIGYDHRFGKNREGSFEYLRDNAGKYGFKVEEIPAQDIDRIAVSSTKIRNALLNGDLDVATQYLGHNYTLEGPVVGGDKIGRDLGYPTANIVPEDKYKLIPADGVYAVQIRHGQQLFDGMVYIGMRPTLEGKKRTIEVNLFDFQGDLYDELLQVILIGRVRGDMKFENLDQLREQIDKDKYAALRILRKNS